MRKERKNCLEEVIDAVVSSLSSDLGKDMCVKKIFSPEEIIYKIYLTSSISRIFKLFGKQEMWGKILCVLYTRNGKIVTVENRNLNTSSLIKTKIIEYCTEKGYSIPYFADKPNDPLWQENLEEE